MVNAHATDLEDLRKVAATGNADYSNWIGIPLAQLIWLEIRLTAQHISSWFAADAFPG